MSKQIDLCFDFSLRNKAYSAPLFLRVDALLRIKQPNSPFSGAAALRPLLIKLPRVGKYFYIVAFLEEFCFYRLTMKRLLFALFFLLAPTVATFADDIPALKRAAEQGDTSAQFNLALCYEDGKGVEKNAEEAVKWYKKAAEQGLAEAQVNLGFCYAEGRGVEKNEAEALNCFKKAAEQGHSAGQFNIALCYYRGTGATQDKIKAYAWFALAKKNEYKNANEKIDTLASELSGKELLQALLLAEKYGKGNFD